MLTHILLNYALPLSPPLINVSKLHVIFFFRCLHSCRNSGFIRIPWSKGSKEEKVGNRKIQLSFSPLCACSKPILSAILFALLSSETTLGFIKILTHTETPPLSPLLFLPFSFSPHNRHL